MRRRTFALGLTACLLAACASSYGRTSLPQREARYTKQIAHNLGRAAAFARVERALEDADDDRPQALRRGAPETFEILLESTVSYRTGGPTGPTRHSKYTLEISITERHIDFAFELGAELDTGHYAPESAIPYIRADFDELVRKVERALPRRGD